MSNDEFFGTLSRPPCPATPLGDFSSRTHILNVFACLSEDGWEDDKAGNNFENLSFLELIDSSMEVAGQKKRRSQPGDSNSGPMRKKAMGGPTASTSTTLQTHLEVSPGREREGG
ncbi:hypothetical protein PsYK624_101640 [Phanerochaete sordida]|uniref:Uncharacterized protein n=1 Tax=Phanerochaete sordida TaxID=48140 RepID=A0A9P3GFI9_9APHY|nr:hypothetical protein PsYK624_101640 [Phanerochaete sordida]